MLTEPEITAVLTPILSGILAVEPMGIKREATLIYDLGAGSLDITEIISSIEEEFGLDISYDDVHRYGLEATVGHIIDHILSCQ